MSVIQWYSSATDNAKSGWHKPYHPDTSSRPFSAGQRLKAWDIHISCSISEFSTILPPTKIFWCSQSRWRDDPALQTSDLTLRYIEDLMKVSYSTETSCKYTKNRLQIPPEVFKMLTYHFESRSSLFIYEHGVLRTRDIVLILFLVTPQHSHILSGQDHVPYCASRQFAM